MPGLTWPASRAARAAVHTRADRTQAAWRLLRTAGKATGAAVGVAGSALVASSVIGTKLLTDAPRPSHGKPTLTVRFHTRASAMQQFAVAERVLEVRGAEALVPGTWGIRVEGAFVLITDPISIGTDDRGEYALRPWRQRDGEPPTFDVTGDRRRGPDDRRDPATDDAAERRRRRDRRRRDEPAPWPYPAVLSAYAWPDDPQILARESGATWEIEAVPMVGGGHLPTWCFTPPDASDTWMIAIHGRGARRAEVFRLVDIALGQGVPCLVVSYRTDAWTRSPAPRTRLGADEWEDVEGAIRLAISRGARRVVLAGCSMGGGIAAATVRHSEFAADVAGVVLDAPALDWGPTLRHIAKVHRVPSFLVPLTMTVARVRAELDFQAVNHVAAANDFAHPILLIHGTNDTVTPVWLSDTLAEARPDLVNYLRVEGAGHVKSWNHARHRYEHAVDAFLDQAARTSPVPLPRRRERLLGITREAVAGHEVFERR